LVQVFERGLNSDRRFALLAELLILIQKCLELPESHLGLYTSGLNEHPLCRDREVGKAGILEGNLLSEKVLLGNPLAEITHLATNDIQLLSCVEWGAELEPQKERSQLLICCVLIFFDLQILRLSLLHRLLRVEVHFLLPLRLFVEFNLAGQTLG